ncbi:hypothetical protein FSY59_12775 [Comamonas sp. Z3]|uniref:hypothetical protein n=1 Tax=Comamonas sp. Z3 TaxID=2601247 RepID=UPI0011E7D79D|nr:hypothetical protein [Comamonas sp. Z3]TYK69420.1 hypothetical protein FSY59_18965 [Comamonas sp. Z3]TYK70429.1 hypothetical protein FSY59_12775 [Comamonas sp. Z3]
MCDSFDLMFNLDQLIPVEEASEQFEFECKVSLKTGQVNYADMLTLKSPITGAGFKMMPCLDKEKKFLVGFRVSMNVPACVIGNNAFVHVLPYEAAKIAMLLLKHYLKNIGVSRKSLTLISLSNAVIRFVDFTYLLKCLDIDDAVLKRNELEDRINALYHYLSTSYRQHVGEDAGRTVYLKIRNHPYVRAYVKYKDIKEKKKYGCEVDVDYLDRATKEKIYELSQRGLRIELCVNGAYLEKLEPGMSRVTAWKDKAKADDVIGKVFEHFRSMLRFGDNLRHNKHRPNDLAKFDQKTQDFLKLYYVGAEGSYVEGLTKSQRYELKKKILKVARIDPTIPWGKHKQLKAWKWCVQPSMPKISKKYPDLLPHVFNMENMPIFYEKIIQAEVNKFNVKNNGGTSDISDLMGDAHVDEKEKTIKSKPYRGFGSLNIPNISNLTDD